MPVMSGDVTLGLVFVIVTALSQALQRLLSLVSPSQDDYGIGKPHESRLTQFDLRQVDWIMPPFKLKNCK